MSITLLFLHEMKEHNLYRWSEWGGDDDDQSEEGCGDDDDQSEEDDDQCEEGCDGDGDDDDDDQSEESDGDGDSDIGYEELTDIVKMMRIWMMAMKFKVIFFMPISTLMVITCFPTTV